MDPKARLLEERRRLEVAADSAKGGLGEGSQSEATGELSSYDQHPADVGTETFYREADQAIAESVQAELEEVDAALRRVEDGTYGRCEACGRPIGDERLEALPAARLCLEDEQRAELEATRGTGSAAGDGDVAGDSPPLHPPG